ncbi:MAG: MFS transporter [Patescibacteria group bacterium]|jgi:MFS family permease
MFIHLPLLRFHRNLSLVKLHGLWGIYLGDLFRRLATSFVGLFIPIYIWQVTGKLIFVPVYYFIYAFVGMVSNYPGALFIRRFGVDWSVVIGTFFRALFIILLIFAKSNQSFFWLSALCFGLAQPFDWLPYYYVISKISNIKHHFGNAAGISNLIAHIGSALGPVIGGIIIKTLGFGWLYSISGGMLVLAALLPFLDEFEKSGMHVSGREIIERLKDSGMKKHLLSYGLRMFDNLAHMVVWPLFLYVIVGSFESSGALQTMSLLIAVIVSYGVGRITDKNNFNLIYLGSLLSALSWWGRLILQSATGLFITNTSYTVGSTMVWTPHTALLLAKSSEKYTMEFWLVRQTICYGFMALFSVLFFIILFFTENFSGIFLALGTTSLLTLFLPYWYREYIYEIKESKE